MKKIISMITILFIIFMMTFSVNIYAASLDTINITTTKTTVHPNETVTVEVEFGEDLGAYTVDVAYDNNLLEYVSAEGGTSDDNGTRVRTTFYDATGGTSPRSNMSVTFKAKNVLTSNPTDLSITAEGLANADASVTYDDITVAITKNVVVEPKYEDYDIDLKYTGDVIENTDKDMKLVVSSAMGKNYEHTRIIAEAITPHNATVQLLGKDSGGLQHDIIQSGWGEADGDAIGGKDVVKELDLIGKFSDVGKYTITFKVINRDNSDAIIANKTVDITVKEKDTTTTPEEKPTTKPESTTKPETKPDTDPETETGKEEAMPNKMPQTGNTIYGYIVPAIIVLGVSYMLLKKKN